MQSEKSHLTRKKSLHINVQAGTSRAPPTIVLTKKVSTSWHMAFRKYILDFFKGYNSLQDI